MSRPGVTIIRSHDRNVDGEHVWEVARSSSGNNCIEVEFSCSQAPQPDGRGGYTPGCRARGKVTKRAMTDLLDRAENLARDRGRR